MKKKEEESKDMEEKEEKSSIEWQAPEFEYRRKSPEWYWLSLIVAIVLLLVSLWQKNFLFAVFIVIAWLVIVRLSRQTPTTWKFELNEKGVEISLPNDDPASVKFYPYDEIEGFDVHSPAASPVSEKESKKTRIEYKELVMKIKRKFSHYLKINFPSADEEKIKNFLQKYLVKEEYGSSITDSFSKLIGF